MTALLVAPQRRGRFAASRPLVEVALLVVGLGALILNIVVAAAVTVIVRMVLPDERSATARS